MTAVAWGAPPPVQVPHHQSEPVFPYVQSKVACVCSRACAARGGDCGPRAFLDTVMYGPYAPHAASAWWEGHVHADLGPPSTPLPSLLFQHFDDLRGSVFYAGRLGNRPLRHAGGV